MSKQAGKAGSRESGKKNLQTWKTGKKGRIEKLNNYQGEPIKIEKGKTSNLRLQEHIASHLKTWNLKMAAVPSQDLSSPELA